MRPLWKRLPLEGQSLSPALYISFTTGSNGYELLLTDLAHVWSECLTRKQILVNSSKYDTTIDPNQDDDQYFVLLQKIDDALSGKKGSRLSLRGQKHGNGLNLSTETDLPSPLEPLTWKMDLSQLPQAAFTKHVFLPVLREAASTESRMRSLIDKLREKDWALGKLCDKIEASGIDLSTVFPTLTGARHGRRESVFSQASKMIKGVAPFDENAWNSECMEQTPNESIKETIIKDFSATESPLDLETVENINDDWWTRIRDSDSAIMGPVASHKVATKKPPPKPAEEISTESDDDFETRQTPPRFRKRPRAPSLAGSEPESIPSLGKGKTRESTASPEPPRPTAPPKQTKRSKGLGIIGSKSSKKELPAEGSTGYDLSMQPEKPKAKSSGFGRIGGRKLKAPRVEDTNSDSSTESDVPPGAFTKKPLAQELSTDEADLALCPSKPQKSKSTGREESDKPSPPPKNKSTTAGAGRVLGQIGGKKKDKGPKPEESKSKSKQSPQENIDDTSTHDQVESSHATAPKMAKRESKLGVIGGGKSPRKQAATKSQAIIPSTATRKDEASDKGNGPISIKTEQSEAPQRSKSPTPQIQAPQKEGSVPTNETPEERANRKREELRRQLESKSGPAKKKRRF
ncbi:uncharacterized protein CIMG_04568 [Coccidioides immitis RS]|uniref:Non-homologous end-joining factor 1 n=1 Tax=Coccidioides immitis (strain RS) TaxID=246410 RepID=J3KDS5_COCIM|nr:uncharacterized protein CIMG_04568 [Coccidioides immitis RS]EAS33544.3 hypothetical protein CIMG_04568 [Coccidioides immitis RS]